MSFHNRSNSPSQEESFVEKTKDEFISNSEKNLKEFNELLDSLATTEDRLKSLWRQIYENALTDRMNSYIIWADLYRTVNGNPTEHAIHGQNLSRYLERMSKANDQLIKLAELVGAAKSKDSAEVTEDSLYSDMESSLTKGQIEKH